MSTTLVFRVVCPKCDYQGEFELDELGPETECAECGENIGTPYRIEGFRRVPIRE